MGVTAKARASTRLDGTTAMAPEGVLELVREACGQVKGGGKSLLTAGIANIGANFKVVRSDGNSMVIALTSGKALVELCTFSARATAAEGGRTEVRVGGLETYKTSQEKLLFLIPVGPKLIPGMDPYKRFLDAIATAIRAADTSAEITVGQKAA